jgi:hypothetical protein
MIAKHYSYKQLLWILFASLMNIFFFGYGIYQEYRGEKWFWSYFICGAILLCALIAFSVSAFRIIRINLRYYAPRVKVLLKKKPNLEKEGFVRPC